MPITTPDAVPGELITAAWGDSVRADLTALDSGKANLIGATFTGSVLLSDTQSGAVNAATRRDYVDGIVGNRVAKVGDVMSGTLQVGGDPATPAEGCAFKPGGGMQTRTATSSAAGGLDLTRASAAAAVGQKFISFTTSSNGIIGSIGVATATSVAYTTTSDPRTKTAPSPRGIGDAAQRAQQLGRLAWEGQHLDPETGQPDGVYWDFLSSHDIEDVAAYAVHGERDGVDETGAPIWQQVSYPDLVPLLFAALANALDRIDALEAATP